MYGCVCHRVVTESDAVSYPEIPHIDRLRALESYSAACNTQSCSVVSEDWSRGLRSCRVWRVGTVACPFRNRAASSASDAADTTVGMIELTMSMAPLRGAVDAGPKEDRK